MITASEALKRTRTTNKREARAGAAATKAAAEAIAQIGPLILKRAVAAVEAKIAEAAHEGLVHTYITMDFLIRDEDRKKWPEPEYPGRCESIEEYVGSHVEAQLSKQGFKASYERGCLFMNWEPESKKKGKKNA